MQVCFGTYVDELYSAGSEIFILSQMCDTDMQMPLKLIASFFDCNACGVETVLLKCIYRCRELNLFDIVVFVCGHFSYRRRV